MSIYTRTGDSGMTSLYGGERLPKSDQIFEVLGSLDELNSWLGLLISMTNFTKLAREELLNIQKDLFLLGSYFADKNNFKNIIEFEARASNIECLIDDIDFQLEPLRNFILPGVSICGSTCHVSRSVCRRVERSLITFLSTSNQNIKVTHAPACKYLNRLSDFLFQLARLINFSHGSSENIWKIDFSKHPTKPIE